jgi:transcriptional regulator with XRE-family HTH domain
MLMTNTFIIGEGLRLAIKGAGLTVEEAAKKLGLSRTSMYNYFRAYELDDSFLHEVRIKLGISLYKDDYVNMVTEFNSLPKPTGDGLRRQKAFGEKEDEGLIFVPIAAQAGYTQYITDPVYLFQLERVKIPGMPYKGDKYRMFEVDGDSMEPTIKNGSHIIAEIIEPQFWRSAANFYIHVIVTEAQVLLKRIYHLDSDTLVLISDNDDYYPQFQIRLEEVKELWVVKRKIDWEMPPPKKFEIHT